MKSKMTFLLHLAGSTPEKPVTSLVAADSISALLIYIEGNNIDALQIQKLPDDLIII